MKKLSVALALVALALSATGVHAQGLQLPIISVTPMSYDFGDVPVDAVASGILVVKNESADAPLTVTAVKTKAPFYDNATSFTLQPGQSRQINIGFAPPAPRRYNSYCTINSNAANQKLVIVSLTGMGVE